MLGFLKKAVGLPSGSSQKKSGGTIIGKTKKSEDNSAKMRVFNPSSSKPVNDSAERVKSRNSGLMRNLVGNMPEPKKMRIGGFRKN